MKISNEKFGMILSIPGLCLIIALVIFPMIMLLITSMLRYIPGYPITFIGFKNFQYIFNDSLFWLSLQKTFIYSGSVTVLTFIGGMSLALLLSKITSGSGVFRVLAMFPWAVPLIISGFIWKWVFDPKVGVFSDLLMKLGLIDKPLPVFSNSILAMIGCIVADVWVRIPFMCVFILAGIESISQHLYEAAKIDGADCIDRFRYITLPLIKHITLVGLLIVSMFTFRTIDVIFSMTRGGPAKATYVLGYYLIDQFWLRVNYGTSSAVGVILFILVLSFSSLYVYLYMKE